MTHHLVEQLKETLAEQLVERDAENILNRQETCQLYVCLGPGRCEKDDTSAGCEWCLAFPSAWGKADIDRFVRWHVRGN